MLVAETSVGMMRVEGRTAAATSPPAKGRMTEALSPIAGRSTVTVTPPSLTAGSCTLANLVFAGEGYFHQRVCAHGLVSSPSYRRRAQQIKQRPGHDSFSHRPAKAPNLAWAN